MKVSSVPPTHLRPLAALPFLLKPWCTDIQLPSSCTVLLHYTAGKITYSMLEDHGLRIGLKVPQARRLFQM
jgi:hypothetical protein